MSSLGAFMRTMESFMSTLRWLMSTFLILMSSLPSPMSTLHQGHLFCKQIDTYAQVFRHVFANISTGIRKYFDMHRKSFDIPPSTTKKDSRNTAEVFLNYLFPFRFLHHAVGKVETDGQGSGVYDVEQPMMRVAGIYAGCHERHSQDEPDNVVVRDACQKHDQDAGYE